MSKILLFQPKNRDVHLLVGGKVCEYETCEEAIKREVLEELGYTVVDLSLLAISEEFVHDKNFDNQQMNVIYKGIYEGDTSIKEFHGLEGDRATYKWVDVKDIENYNIYPSKTKEIVKDLSRTYHIVENLLDKNVDSKNGKC